MKIAFRTGAGRGAYELAGRQGNLSASDLFGLEISYEITPGIVIPGRSVADVRQGKPRITLDEATRSRTTHVYRLLSAVLLLPTPTRQFRSTHGEDLLQAQSYAMTAIQVDVAKHNNESVVFRPTNLLLENNDDLQAQVDFTARMARVLRLWEAAAHQDSPLAESIRKLSAVIREEDPDYKEIERWAQSIATTLDTTGDVLPLAEQALEVPAQPERRVLPQETRDAFGLDDAVSPQEALITRIKKWRKLAERGVSGRKFSRNVSNAYDYRCLFTGQRLPRFELTASSGVDSAHILPWTAYDLNSVNNGLCLNKQCHWAFDQGLLRLEFDGSCNSYILRVPNDVHEAAVSASFDIAYFESLSGPIPRGRLPQNTSQWPAPKYIEELNRYMDSV